MVSVSTPSTRAAREQWCLDAVRRLAALVRGAGSPWLELDLTMGQLKVMMALSALGPLSVGRLGRRLGIAEPSASLLVDKLQALDLVCRHNDPADRRRILFELTDRADALVELLRGLGSDDLKALERGMWAVVRVADAPRGADRRPADEGGSA